MTTIDSAIDLPCPYCGVDPGHSCLRGSPAPGKRNIGKPVKQPHAERVQAHRLIEGIIDGTIDPRPLLRWMADGRA